MTSAAGAYHDFWVPYIPMFGAGSLFSSNLPLFSLQLLRDMQRALRLS